MVPRDAGEGESARATKTERGERAMDKATRTIE